MRIAAGFVVVAACSAPATLNDLKVAERRADAGDTDGAIAAYRAAQTSCRHVKSRRRAKAACAEALLGEAELLAHTNQTQPAIDSYLAIPGKIGDDGATSAIATYRAGELLLRANQATAAWTALWRVVTDWPDEASAADALRTLLVDGRGRDARALADQIERILTPLADTGIADNLLWTLADLTEHELGNAAAARAFYDRIPIDYPKSGLRDDARWHAARISRALGDPKGAAQRLRGLLATRETTLGPGSYFSIWLDDGQLELGRVLRDDLGDLAGAIAAFRQLPKHYPASILKDDALYELAVTLDRAGDHPAACRAVTELATQDPDSKYLARGNALCAADPPRSGAP